MIWGAKIAKEDPTPRCIPFLFPITRKNIFFLYFLPGKQWGAYRLPRVSLFTGFFLILPNEIESHHNLIKELQLQDSEDFRRFLRMNTDTFQVSMLYSVARGPRILGQVLMLVAKKYSLNQLF